MLLNASETLRIASLIIIDEITMLTKYGLRCNDQCLPDIMQIDLSFERKVIVIGGDFRQTLPVVTKGTRVDIIECCIKTSSLWQHFTQLKLSRNMRCESKNYHNRWLLNFRSNNMLELLGAPSNSIVIPQQMIANENLVNTIYGENLIKITAEELAKGVILAPTNKKCYK